MSQEKKSPAGGQAQDRTTLGNEKHTTKTPRPTKKRRVLNALLAGGDYNRFEAERLLNDHVLNTTISKLEKDGITIARKWERVPGWRGIPTRCKRYWLDREEIDRIQEQRSAQ